MKGILVLILAAAVGYAAYEYVYPLIAEKMKFEKHLPKKQEVVVAPAPPVKRQVVVEPPKPAVEPPTPKPMAEAKPAPMPVIPEPKPEPPKPKDGDFVAPEFPPIDVVVQNWTAIPKSAFPRAVKLKKDLDLKMKIGNSTAATQVKAGGQIIAMGQDGTSILVSPTETSPMRGRVSIDDTDIKEMLTNVYERWKVARLETLRRAHEFKLVAAERAKNAPPSAKGTAAAGNDKPAKDADGTYPLLIASMKSGQVTEIKPESIKEWGEPQLTDGVWTVIVKYETQTMFGKFDTEAQAQIKNGRVDKWIYTGSGEVVP
ncbi:MAG: hypothetical protein U0984_03330 [Prosthecobacter sp.]|nr:hypothetical protein [Prosthecobacter sp.]